MDNNLTTYRVVVKGGLNVRSADTLNAPVLEVYPVGKEFQGYNPEGLSWIRTTLPDGVTGYILNEPYLVEEVKPVKKSKTE